MITIKNKTDIATIHLNQVEGNDDYVLLSTYASTIDEILSELAEIEAILPEEPVVPDEPIIPPTNVNIMPVKHIDLSTTNKTVYPDNGFDAMASVSIHAFPLYDRGKNDGAMEQKNKLTSITITQNGTYKNDNGYNKVIVDIDVDNPQPVYNLQEYKNVKLTNAYESIYPDDGFDAMKRVYVNASAIEPDRTLHFDEIGYEDDFIKRIYGDINDEIEFSKNFDFDTGDKSKLVYFPRIDTSKLPSIKNYIEGAYKLYAIPRLNCENVLDEKIVFTSANLRHCYGFVEIKANLDFTECTNLSVKSINAICFHLFSFYPYNDWGDALRTIKFNEKLVTDYYKNGDGETKYLLDDAFAQCIVKGWQFEPYYYKH